MAIAPLKGIRVLDFGQVWAGPLLGVYLGDFGAEVIQVVSVARSAVQATAGVAGEPGPIAYSSLGRNRKAITLDPTNAAGQEVFQRLVAASDIVFDNFSPRAARKLGITYELLRQVNSRIIVCSMSAAGQSGPWSDLLTYGPSLTALYGIKSLLGYAGESRIQEDVADLDPTAATYAFIAVLAALRARERTGEGQLIDMAQGEAGLASLAEAFLEYSFNGRELGPSGNRNRRMAPHGIYPCLGEDRWISIAVDSEAAWHALCGVLGRPDLASDDRFVTMFRRLGNQDALDVAIGALTASQDAEELTERLQATGVAAYPVLDSFGVIANDQLAFRRAGYAVAAEGITPEQVVNPTPWRMVGSPPTVYSPARPLGADNDYVYDTILGMGAAERAKFSARGAFG